MQLRSFIICFFIAQSSFAQTKVADTSRLPVVTATGKPLGNSTSAKIGAKGGVLKSADGRLHVIFPAGALDTETTISIQSVTNEINETTEGAYQLEPSGIKFKKPVHLVFYTLPDQEYSGIATQSEKGQWFQLKNIVIDPVKNTVKGLVPHFSYWTVVSRFVLKPKKATVQTNGTVKLYIAEYPPPKQEPAENIPVKNGPSVDGDLLEPLVQVEVNDVNSNGQSVDGNILPPLKKNNDDELQSLKHRYDVLSWAVNGIENGNSEVGTISGKKTANFKAPSSVPSQNPVAVSVKLKIYFPKGVTKTVLLVSNIKITGPGYLFTYIHKNFAGCFHYIDSSSCVIQFDDKLASISNIINYKPWSDWDPCTKCNHQYTNKETYKANVEIAGMQSSKVIPASKEKPMTEVYIALLPSFGNTPAAEQQCPRSPKVVVPSMPLPADPKYIHFETDGNEIIVHYYGESSKNMIHKKIKTEETIIKIRRL
jgi:hypothetical protein